MQECYAASVRGLAPAVSYRGARTVVACAGVRCHGPILRLPVGSQDLQNPVCNTSLFCRDSPWDSHTMWTHNPGLCSSPGGRHPCHACSVFTLNKELLSPKPPCISRVARDGRRLDQQVSTTDSPKPEKARGTAPPIPPYTT